MSDQKKPEKTRANPFEDLAEQESFFTRIDEIIQKFPSTNPSSRFSLRRILILRKIQKDLVRYQDVQLDKLLTLKQMQKAIDNELKVVDR